MEGLDIGALIATWGWQAAVTAFAACFVIGMLKPLIRKGVTNEKYRHALYTALNAVFVAIGAVLVVGFTEGWVLDIDYYAPAFIAGYALLNILYPMYSNWGPQEWWNGALGIVKKILAQKKKETQEPPKSVTI